MRLEEASHGLSNLVRTFLIPRSEEELRRRSHRLLDASLSTRVPLLVPLLSSSGMRTVIHNALRDSIEQPSIKVAQRVARTELSRECCDRRLTLYSSLLRCL